jgi:hypothetical protein
MGRLAAKRTNTSESSCLRGRRCNRAILRAGEKPNKRKNLKASRRSAFHSRRGRFACSVPRRSRPFWRVHRRRKVCGE